MGSTVAIGQVLAGKYYVERMLGQGGMGVVVAARHIELDEMFAVKVMLPEAFSEPGAVERFVREARTSARLKSPHAAKVVDSGRLDSGEPFLVMEHLVGRDLERDLGARGIMGFREASAFVLQACDAIAEAHQLGIVHRDIKPANLFLTRLPNGLACVKVLDFGIAKQTDPLKGAAMTQTSSVFGSPLYMSPEQMRSAKSADARSDVWSLGVVLYELTTGVPPYRCESVTELVARVMTEAPRHISEQGRGLPRAFEQVVMACLDRNPDRRPPNAGALAAALAPLAGDGRVQLSEGWLSEPGPRSTGVAAGLSAAPTPAEITRSAMGISTPNDGRWDSTAPVRGGGGRAMIIALGALLVLAAAGVGVFAAWKRSPAALGDVGAEAPPSAPTTAFQHSGLQSPSAPPPQTPLGAVTSDAPSVIPVPSARTDTAPSASVSAAQPPSAPATPAPKAPSGKAPPTATTARPKSSATGTQRHGGFL